MRDRSQSEVIGVVLLVGVVVTVVFAASVFVVPTVLSGTDDPLLSIDAEASLQNVTITHAGGETVDAEDVRVLLEGEDTERYALTTFTQLRGDDSTTFEEGDGWSRSHGIDADRMEILLVHTPTNTVVRETVAVTDTLAPRFDWDTTTTTTLDTVEFDASESRYEEGAITSYGWEILDGAENFGTDTGEQVTHSFSDPGTYQVRLTIRTDDGRSATRTRTIEVFSPPPQAAFTYEPATPESGEQVTFNASDSEAPDGTITSYSWEFGDGNTSTGEEVTHTYANPGTYSVILTVTDDDGRTVSKTRGITIEARPPMFNVSIDAANDPVVGETLTVGATVENTGGQTDTQDIVLAVNGTGVETQSVSLDGGATANLSFTYDTGIGDLPALALNVSSDDDFATETVTVQPRIRLFNARPGSSNTEVQFDVENNAPNTVTVEAITVNDTSSTATRVNTGGGGNELAFTGGGQLNTGGGSAGIEIGTSRYDLDIAETLPGEGRTTGTLVEFDGGGDPAMVGETLTVTLYLSNGETYTETLTVDTRPYFAIEIVDTNSPATEGEELVVDYNVTNVGSTNGVQNVGLEFEGAETDVTRNVPLGAGESSEGTLTHNLTDELPGEYDVTVFTANESKSTTVDVTEEGTPFLDVDITETNEPVTEGELLTVTAAITNTGSANATDEEITLDIDGVGEVDTTTVSVNTTETETVTLDWQTTAGDNGEYTVMAASNDDEGTADVRILAGPIFEALTASVGINERGGSNPNRIDQATFDYTVNQESTITFSLIDSDGNVVSETEITGETGTVSLDGGRENLPVTLRATIDGGGCLEIEVPSGTNDGTTFDLRNDGQECPNSGTSSMLHPTDVNNHARSRGVDGYRARSRARQDV